MNTRMMVWAGVLLVCAALAAGCTRTTSSNVAEVYSITGPEGEIEVRKNIVVNRPWLAQRLEFGDIRTRSTPNGFLEVQVAVTNTRTTTQQLEYSFAWYDADGFQVEAVGSAWKPHVIYGKQTVELQSIAPTPAATSVKVFVRAPAPVAE